jgi:hypothetical protein
VISRRTFLAGSLAAAAITACGGKSGGSDAKNGDDSTTTSSGPLVPAVLGAGFADGYNSQTSALVAGIPQRAPFAAFTEIGEVVRGNSAPASVDVELRHGGSTLAAMTIPRHADGIPTPYYPLVFTPPEPGDYEIHASFASKPTPFRVASRDQVSLVQVGDKMRPVVTPTTTDARGVKPICTRTDPCPFHQMTLTDALASGKPVALIISTPGFCQTMICGPVLELLIDAASSHPELAIVHAEVYVDPQSGNLSKTTEVISTYGLTYEPTFFAADATGTVRARLDFSWDRAELTQALASLA